MRTTLRLTALLTVCLAVASPAAAQRFTFEKSLDAGTAATLDVTTERGKIDITTGDEAHIVIKGTVTVRVGVNVPANAVTLAQQLADQPTTIEQSGTVVRVQPPKEDDVRRAVTVSYEIRVPAQAIVSAISDSGAIAVHGVGGALTVTTRSGAISLSGLGALANITTGSGAVSLTGAGGPVTVRTQSSGITLRELRSNLDAHTQSGSVNATFTAPGDVVVETGSSEISLSGVNGSLTTTTRSGRTTVVGRATKPWTSSSTSGGIRLAVGSGGLTVEATTGSGSVVIEGLRVDGTIEKRKVVGTVARGGPAVRATSRSGSIRITHD
ncbi:MAG: DUF4097 family beta strand repeat-containing protein [Vicinamibacterales bacterium]